MEFLNDIWDSTIAALKFVERHHEGGRSLGLVAAAVVGFTIAFKRNAIADKQAKIAADNHLAETYTKAIDQIGEDGKEAIQLGGLYALEKIARNNEEYQGQIMDVLSGFVRLRKGSGVIIAETALAIIGKTRFQFENTPDRKNENEKGLDLSGLDLQGAQLQGAQLQGAILFGANLQGANLQDANLHTAKIQDADLQEASLQGADLSGAQLEGINFLKTNLQKANLKGVNFTDVDLKETQLDLPPKKWTH